MGIGQIDKMQVFEDSAPSPESGACGDAGGLGTNVASLTHKRNSPAGGFEPACVRPQTVGR